MSSTSDCFSQSPNKSSSIQKKSRKESYKLIDSIHEKAKAQAIKEYRPREDVKEGLTKKQISNIQSAERSRIKKNILVKMLENEVNKTENSSQKLRNEIINLRFSMECMKQEMEQKKEEIRRKKESQDAFYLSCETTPVDLIQNQVLIGDSYDDVLSPILLDYSENIEDTYIQDDEIDRECQSIVEYLKRNQTMEEEDMNDTFCGQHVKRMRIVGESHESFDDLTQPDENEESVYKRLEFISSPVTIADTPASLPDDLIELTPSDPSFH